MALPAADFPERDYDALEQTDGVSTMDASDVNIPYAELKAIQAAFQELCFGDGSDGDITISGNTTLTRDMFYNSLTVNNGITLTTDGFLQ